MNYLAHVDAGIFRNDRADVEGDVAKVVSDAESGSHLQLHAIDVPFEAQRSISDRQDATLEVSVAAFRQFRRSDQCGSEDGFVEAEVFFVGWLESLSLLQLLDFAHAFRMLRLPLNSGFGHHFDGSSGNSFDCG